MNADRAQQGSDSARPPCAGLAANASGRLWLERMTQTLQTVLEVLRAHEAQLRRMGVSHAAVFGSVARGEAGGGSDVDVLIDLDQSHELGIFEYARLKLYINQVLGGAGDVVNRHTLKPLLRDSILGDAIHAFYARSVKFFAARSLALIVGFDSHPRGKGRPGCVRRQTRMSAPLGRRQLAGADASFGE
jgi:hypothetical protein